MLGQCSVQIKADQFLLLFPPQLADGVHQAFHALRLVGGDVGDTVPHREVSKIVTVHRPENRLKACGAHVIQIMSGVDHHIIIIGYSGIATILEFLHRICLPRRDRNHLSTRVKAHNLVAKMLAERDETHLVVHIHLITEGDDLLRQPGLPRRGRVGLEFQKKLQCRSALRLGEIFPQ